MKFTIIVVLLFGTFAHASTCRVQFRECLKKTVKDDLGIYLKPAQLACENKLKVCKLKESK